MLQRVVAAPESVINLMVLHLSDRRLCRAQKFKYADDFIDRYSDI